jgi:hypothetical protein
MHVAIIGAGLAGPLLARWLCQLGAEVVLVERRQPDEHRRAGYRIHLDPEGDLALRAGLPPHLYELVVLTSDLTGGGVRIEMQQRLDRRTRPVKERGQQQTQASPASDTRPVAHTGPDTTSPIQTTQYPARGWIRIRARLAEPGSGERAVRGLLGRPEAEGVRASVPPRTRAVACLLYDRDVDDFAESFDGPVFVVTGLYDEAVFAGLEVHLDLVGAIAEVDPGVGLRDFGAGRQAVRVETEVVVNDTFAGRLHDLGHGVDLDVLGAERHGERAGHGGSVPRLGEEDAGFAGAGPGAAGDERGGEAEWQQGRQGAFPGVRAESVGCAHRVSSAA